MNLVSRTRPRLIPILLLDGHRRLVKTVGFGERTYVGDPFNVVRLFNEKEVDELCVLDIDATREGRAPDVGFLGELASECFMPLAYGGGITTVGQCLALNKAGIEKFIIGSAAGDEELLRAIARSLGSQALVVCIDARGAGSSAVCYARSGQISLSTSPLALAERAVVAGAGEILLQSIDRDGARNGMALELIARVCSAVPVPVIAAGGAGTLEHLFEALQAGASASASGSAFCFIGRLRAVLISYPRYDAAPARLGQAARLA